MEGGGGVITEFRPERQGKIVVEKNESLRPFI